MFDSHTALAHGGHRWRRWHAGLGLLILALSWTSCSRKPESAEEEFIRVMNTGKNYLDQKQATNAIPPFLRAVELQPSRPDALLNLANAYLLAGQAEAAVRQAEAALSYDRNLAAAYYVAGCGHLRLRQYTEGLQMLQPSRDLDGTVAAVHFQIARAHQELNQLEDAIAAYQETIKLEPEHPVAHYALSQALIRAGQQDDALKAIERHNAIRAKSSGAPTNPEAYEQCKHTIARAPQQILKPDPQGIAVTFVDATPATLGTNAARFRGPMAVLDFNRDDRNSLFAREGTNGFRLLANQAGVFTPQGNVLPAHPDGRYRQMLVGDLNNDRFEDVLVLGEGASHVFRFATNGVAREVTAAAGLKGLVGQSGALVDLDFTGNLNLLLVLPGGKGLRVLRNLGNLYFRDITATSGFPAQVEGPGQIAIDDWNNDDQMDVLISRVSGAPLYLQKQRGGPVVPTALPGESLTGAALALGDMNGDSRTDLLVGSPERVDLLLGGVNRLSRLPVGLPGLSQVRLVDYDNDGWLDLLLAGEGLQAWRNLGDGRFTNLTARLGLGGIGSRRVDDLAAADFDQDGDTDLVLSLADEGLRLYRNDGGDANRQLKLRLFGNRSNATGLGIRLEVAAGAFRVHRTVSTLPIEIGVGRYDRLDSLTARWFDLAFNQIDVVPDPRQTIPVFEPTLPTGSCPYLYAWDGQGFRFVSDILGSSPLGLRVAETVFADADPREHVALGDLSRFPPRDGRHVVQITEELREVLYLDEARLVVVDHAPGTEVHTTDKFRPGKPFPPGDLWTLERRRPLRQATRLDGTDCTEALQQVDGDMVSPERLRIPQLRGLAEPHGVVLDFGSLTRDESEPGTGDGPPISVPVLVLTGWLRFGGGMANVAASLNPDLPFPFPKLEVEIGQREWRPVDVVVGAPSGKTKTILVDLKGALPPGSGRLRLSTAFEIHWDRIALFERRSVADTQVTRLAPDFTDLHWRGFSEFADLPWTQPLTPVYGKVFQNPHWAITPMGWCTRYGPVTELVAVEDNALVLLNGGDELTLGWSVDRLPPSAPGQVRDFFLYTVGWDKDSDFHVELGWKVEPLPWHGMDDQRYGQQARPVLPSDELMRRHTTRWVPPHTQKRAAR